MENDIPAPTPQNQNAPIRVWWDVENCLLPDDILPTDVHDTIRRTMARAGYSGDLIINAVVSNATHPGFPSPRRRTFAALAQPDSHIHFHDCEDPSKRKNIADNEIVDQINIWREENPTPANVLLISGDAGFLGTVNTLLGEGYNVMLAYRTDAAGFEMRYSKVRSKWTWRRLLNLPPQRCKQMGSRRRPDDKDDPSRKGKGGGQRSSGKGVGQRSTGLFQIFTCFGC